MTFSERASRSVNNLRIIFILDITQLHSKWVNAGVGVWYFNTLGLYPEVDSTLLDGFGPVSFAAVGSVLVDVTPYIEADSVLECSENKETFYWDGTSLYVHFHDDTFPAIHQVYVGIAYGYSDHGFTPESTKRFYEGRLLAVPSVSKSRDPLYFGKIQYEGGSVTLNNSDGSFDLFGESNDLYGNRAQIVAGFSELPYSEYVNIFTGTVDEVNISESEATISIQDKRKQLTKQITYSCSSKNALTAIEEILDTNYSIAYNSLYYDTVAWEVARTKTPLVSLSITETTSTIDIIEQICAAAFGILIINPDGKYSFKVTRPHDVAEFEIFEGDILNYPTATYSPAEVISSTKVGYAKDWSTSGTAYTYFTDTSQEATIVSRYRTYNQKTFDTVLPTLATAQEYSDNILDYVGTIRPVIDIVVPLKYYEIDVGDFVDVAINRRNTEWFGTRKCEVIGKTYNLDSNSISLTVRKYGGEIAYRVTTTGAGRVTSDGYTRKVGA